MLAVVWDTLGAADTATRVLITLAFLAVICLVHVVRRPLVYRRDLPKGHRPKDIGTPDDMPPPFPNSWFGVAHEEDVKPGKAIEVRLMGKTLVVFRGQDGIISVLDAFCPHMGANLAGGKVIHNSIECPFHGWSFDHDGNVNDIPYSPTKTIKIGKARKYHSLEMNGIIFVYFHSDEDHGDSVTPPWKPFAFADVGHGKGYRFCGRVEHHVNSHLIEHPENAADTAHFNFLHGDLVFPLLQWLLAHKWQAVYAPSSEPDRLHIANLSVTHDLTLLGRSLFPAAVTRVTQVGPGFGCLRVETIFGEVVFFECTTPIEALHQRIVHTCWSGRFVPAFLSKIMFKSMMIQLERDIALWTRKKFVRSPVLVQGDGPIHQYRRWFNQFYSDSSVTMERALKHEAMRHSSCSIEW